MSGALLQHPRFDFAGVVDACGGCGRVQQYDGNGLVLNVGFDNHRPACLADVAGFLQFDVPHAFLTRALEFYSFAARFGLYRGVVEVELVRICGYWAAALTMRLRSLAVETFWKLSPVGS